MKVITIEVTLGSYLSALDIAEEMGCTIDEVYDAALLVASDPVTPVVPSGVLHAPLLGRLKDVLFDNKIYGGNSNGNN